MKLEKDFWGHLEAQVKLEEWEERCDKCKGLGSKYKYLGNDNSFPIRCHKCKGTGKIDFIEKIVGKKPSNVISYTVHNNSERDVTIGDLGISIDKDDSIDLGDRFTIKQIESSEDLKTLINEGVSTYGE